MEQQPAATATVQPERGAKKDVHLRRGAVHRKFCPEIEKTCLINESPYETKIKNSLHGEAALNDIYPVFWTPVQN